MRYRELRRHGDEDLVVDYDLGGQVLDLELKQTDLDHHGGEDGEEPPLYPTLKEITGPGYECFVSASVLAMKAQRFDEELYAMVEHLCEEDRPGFLSKPSLMAGLLARLNDRYDPKEPDPSLVEAMGFIWAAAKLGGHEMPAGTKVMEAGSAMRKTFLAGPEAKPIGFFNGSLELRQIFRRDSFLAQRLNPTLARYLTEALGSDARLLRGYQTLANLTARMTNPLMEKPLDPCSDDFSGCHFLPRLMSHEDDLIRRLRMGRLCEGDRVARLLATRIAAGELDTTPSRDSGWYAYLECAQTPLLDPKNMPGGEKLRFGPRYRAYLEDLFCSLLAVTREHHTEFGGLEEPTRSPSLRIFPNLSLEPLPEYYRRRARAYAFVRELLLDIFGESLLLRTQHRPNRRLSTTIIHPWTDAEDAHESPLSRLVDIESLFSGAYYQTCAEIGYQDREEDSRFGRTRLQDRLTFRKWLRTWRSDRHIGGDQRAMVPLGHNPRTGKMKVTAIIGFAREHLSVHYHQRPTVRISRADGSDLDAGEITWTGQVAELVYPVTITLEVDEVLDANQLRAICDRFSSRREIRNALAGPSKIKPVRLLDQSDKSRARR